MSEKPREDLAYSGNTAFSGNSAIAALVKDLRKADAKHSLDSGDYAYALGVHFVASLMEDYTRICRDGDVKKAKAAVKEAIPDFLLAVSASLSSVRVKSNADGLH